MNIAQHQHHDERPVTPYRALAGRGARFVSCHRTNDRTALCQAFDSSVENGD